MQLSRRSFIKTTSQAGAAGILMSGAPTNVLAKHSARYARMIINDSIDNMRVVCCHDSEMVTADPSSWDMASQNEPVVAGKVNANMDAMAIQLAQSADAASAWTTIFRKPDTKQWSEVVAAIKINAIGVNHPRIAVVNKICTVLTNLGVAEENIWIYDASRNAETLYSSYLGNGLPANSHVTNGSGTVDVPVGSGQLGCTTVIAESDGSGGVRYKVDIIVNIAVNKNHGYGGTTLTMKNHVGTLKLSCPSGVDQLFDMAASDAIVGGTPPRQQLCIVDSLWASTADGPSADPDRSPHRLVMGVFSPAVDYATVKNIRESMGANHTDSTIERYLTDFSYSASELDWVDVTPASTAAAPPQTARLQHESSITVRVGNHQTTTRIRCGGNITGASLHTLNGKRIAAIIPKSQEPGAAVSLNFPGASITAGTYVLSISGAGWRNATRIRM